VEVLFTTCEEVGLRGAKVFDSSGLAAQAGFVFDSSGPLGRIITAAPTQKTLVADFKGVAAHAGIEPQKGRSAVVAAARAVAAMTLGRIDEATTANVGLISGGVATNIVPEHCRVEAEARSREPARLSAQIADMLAAVNEAATLVGVDVVTSVVEEYAAFDIEPEALPVRLAWRALEAVGLEPSLGATGGGSDVNVSTPRVCPASTSTSVSKTYTPRRSTCRSIACSSATSWCEPWSPPPPTRGTAAWPARRGRVATTFAMRASTSTSTTCSSSAA